MINVSEDAHSHAAMAVGLHIILGLYLGGTSEFNGFENSWDVGESKSEGLGRVVHVPLTHKVGEELSGELGHSVGSVNLSEGGLELAGCLWDLFQGVIDVFNQGNFQRDDSELILQLQVL